jgi:hypothetical protein
MHRRRVIVVCLLLASCGGGSSPTTPAPGPAQPTVTISASGTVTPAITVSPGARVLFVNGDSRPHEMGSDPHPDHTDCPEINQVGLLTPGQRRETGNLNSVRTCGFHDHRDPSNTALRGTIVIR